MLLAMGFGAAQFKNHILLERENLLASIGNQQENHCTRENLLAMANRRDLGQTWTNLSMLLFDIFPSLIFRISKILPKDY